MRTSGLLNPALVAAIARIGHTEFLVIADPGLPLPKGVEVIDLTLTRGIPPFMQVLQAVKAEFVVESYILASEASRKSPELYGQIVGCLDRLPGKEVPHEQFKELVKCAKVIVRTSETTPYANVILVGGVDF